MSSRYIALIPYPNGRRLQHPKLPTEDGRPIPQGRQALSFARLSCSEISRTCGVSLSGVKGHIREYDRHLILAQYNSPCDKEAIEAYDSMDYIEYNISQIARCFGLDDTNLSKQLRTHYPRVIKRHEKVRKRLGLSDNLPHGTRQFCKKRYAGAERLLRGDRYITFSEAARSSDISDWSSICCFTTKSLWASVLRFGKRRSNNSAKAK